MLKVSCKPSYDVFMYVDTRGGWSLVLFAMTLAASACSSESTHAPNYEGLDEFAHAYDLNAEVCAVPGKEGCPCTETGVTVECGRITQVKGDYITCAMGSATCDGAAWGACTGNREVQKAKVNRALSPDSRDTLGIASDCDNPCDPSCTQVAGELTDVDSGGVTVTDVGISITEELGTGGPGTGDCRGLWCQVVACSGQSKTSLSGKVYDPAGKNPLYNAYVYIPVDPAAPLPAFPSGASCDTCAGAAAVSAIAVAQTGSDGAFRLENVPSGSGVPLVVQMGKWRRKVTLPALSACVDNPVASSNSHLPRNRFDGDGNVADIPRMAIASGSADPFECLLLKIGIDPDEIRLPGAGARIDYYRYNGKDRYPGSAPAGSLLTSSLSTLKQYDVVLLPCEGRENAHNAQAPNLVAYTAAGGRIFTTHYGYAWLATPVTPGVASNLTEFFGTASWDIGRWDFNDPMVASVDQSFPKGIAFAQWLQNVNANTTLGAMRVVEPRHNALNAVVGKSQRWVYGSSEVAASGTPDMLLAMTFNTPVNVAEESQCGRVVFSDFHVSADALVSVSGCSADSDCGFGAICNPGVAGQCVETTCRTDADCGAGFSCAGATEGTCSTQRCWSSWSCGGRACNSGSCADGSCYANSDCGAMGFCTGGALGSCVRSCSSASDCSGAFACVSGLCKQSCFSHSECASRFCENAVSSSCSTAGSMFPLSCRNAELTEQEKALEFMLFDLSACVSPDSWAPPVPSTQYNPVTFGVDFIADCAADTQPVWREFQWQAVVPNSADITFEVATATDVAELDAATVTPLAVAESDTVLPNWDVALIDTEEGAFRSADPPQVSLQTLRVIITLNPSEDLKASPLLSKWRVMYDCLDAL